MFDKLSIRVLPRRFCKNRDVDNDIDEFHSMVELVAISLRTKILFALSFCKYITYARFDDIATIENDRRRVKERYEI